MNLNQLKRQARIYLVRGTLCVITLLVIVALCLLFSYRAFTKQDSVITWQDVQTAWGLLIASVLFLGVAISVGWQLRKLRRETQELEELEDQELEELKQSYAFEFEKQLKLSGYDGSGTRK